MEEINGLSQAESGIYLAILKLKIATVRDIAKATGFHRTNIYDILEKLAEKGLVSAYKEGNVLRYKCSDPQNLYNHVDEAKEQLDRVVPEMQKLYRETEEKIDITVFRGRRGLTSAYKDILREGQKVHGFGISRKMHEHLPVFREQFFRDVRIKNIAFELIYTRKLEPLPTPFVSRYLPEEFESPIEVLLYGDKALQLIWEPEMRAILIKSKAFTKAYLRHFEVLWKQALAMD